MNRFILLSFLFVGTINWLSAQRFFSLTGNIVDTSGQALQGVNVRLRNDNLGTASNESGFFKLKLEEGYYEIIVSAIGYENFSLNLPINKDINIKITLKEKQNQLNEVAISSKRHDQSWSIIQKVIANRNITNAALLNYKCSGYIKASDLLIVDSANLKKKHFFKKNTRLNIDSAEAELKKTEALIPNMNFAEIDLVKYWGKPSNIKEERLGIRILGDKNSLYFLSVTDGEFNFYKNQVELGKLSEVKYISPFSPGANASYKFKFLGSYYEGTQKIYKIKVIPRKIGNALFEGEADIYDSIWAIKSVAFQLNPNHIPNYSTFKIIQEYNLADEGFVLLKNQVFSYTKKAKNGQRKGETIVHYSNYLTNIKLAARFFGNELSSALDSAYERNTEWWNKQRKDSLNKNELLFTHYRDSLNSLRTSKAYLDSIDKIYNKITPLKLLWWGQGHINREKKLRIEYSPLISMIQPGTVGGLRLGSFVQINKKYKNRQAVSFNPYVHYGFLNEDLKGAVFLSHLYNPIRRSRYYIYTAREFMMINPNDAFINLFRRSNYFDQHRVQLGHQFEVINGMYFSSYITYSERKDILNYKFTELGDEIFKKDNLPKKFRPHQSTEIKLILSYTPRQQYIKEPNEKIILGSKFPTFSVIYNQGIKNWLGSDVNFCYLQSSLSQTINYGRIGIAKYNISTGKFFDTTMLPIVDYKYQRQGDPYLLTNPLWAYQLLPKTFPTFNWYLEAHYWHSFNGFITSGIPLFKQLNINAAAGSSLLWSVENNLRHIEICYGLNKVFKLLRETFKIGVYFANAYNNSGGYYQGVKFSIEKYNVRDNSWSF